MACHINGVVQTQEANARAGGDTKHGFASLPIVAHTNVDTQGEGGVPARNAAEYRVAAR